MASAPPQEDFESACLDSQISEADVADVPEGLISLVPHGVMHSAELEGQFQSVSVSRQLLSHNSSSEIVANSNDWETRHDEAVKLAFRNVPVFGLDRHKPSTVSVILSSRRSYAKQEYMFLKYVKGSGKRATDAEEAETVKESEIEVSLVAQGFEGDVDDFPDASFDGIGDLLGDDNGDDNVFPTIKDVAEFEARKTEELWSRVENESVDFTNYDEDVKKEEGKDEDSAGERACLLGKRKASCEKTTGRKKSRTGRMLRKSNSIVLADYHLPQTWADSVAMSKNDRLFTKKGSVRMRTVRRDVKRFLPAVNPVLPVEGRERKRPPTTLQDYLVVKSVVGKRFKYKGKLTPEEKFLLKQAYNEGDPDSEHDVGPLSRHIYGCLYCNFMGAKKNWLKHLRNKHRDVESLVFCTYTRFCNMPFDRTQDLDAHIELVHANHDQTGPRSTAVSLYQRTDVKPDPGPDDSPDGFSPMKTSGLFYCMFCDYSHSKRNWVHHLKTKHKDKELFYCTSNKQCNLIFDSVEKLDAHVNAMHKSHTCSVCGQEFKQATVLREHRKIHNPELDLNADPDLNVDACFVCTFCGKKYKTRKGCREHEALQHDHRKLRHRCDFVEPPEKGGAKCQVAFYSAKELVVHKRKHTGELPFICGYCGNRYISKATLDQHERTRHLETENVECELCHKKLKKRNLAFHIKRHDGFVSVPCKYCGKTFSSIGARNRHEKIHTQDKQYSCSFCGKAFVQKSNLQSHERIHTGERPYACKHCGEGFMQHTRRNVHQASCRSQVVSSSVPPAAGNLVPAIAPLQPNHSQTVIHQA